MKKMRILSCLALIALAACATPTPPKPEPQLEVAAIMDINPGNAAISASGRLFATIHPFRPSALKLVEITAVNSYRAYPNKKFQSRLTAPLGVRIDDKNRLWVIDTGSGKTRHQPKLFAFDIARNRLAFEYELPKSVAPTGSFPQDLAIDSARGFVYIADVGMKTDPGIITVDIARKKSWKLTGHPAFAAENVDMIIDGRTIGLTDGKGEFTPARIGINPITLSADGNTLYFGAMNGNSWWALPAKFLREHKNYGEVIAKAAIYNVGPKPVSDGASTDAEGNHYFTDLQNKAIDRLSAKGDFETIIQDPRLDWPDSISFGKDGYMYIAVNQLHKSPALNSGHEGGKPPYFIYRVKTDSIGQIGR